jgi:hypothetical protein
MVNIDMNRKSTNEQKQKAEERGRSSEKIVYVLSQMVYVSGQFYSLLVFFLGHGRKKKSNPPYTVPFLVLASLGTVTLHPVQCFVRGCRIRNALFLFGTMWIGTVRLMNEHEIWPQERLWIPINGEILLLSLFRVC